MPTTRAAGLGLVAAAAALVAGCGGGNGGSGGGPSGASAVLKPPAKPTAADCRADVLRTNVKPSNLVPPPGNYTYSTNGTRQDVNGGASTSLPTSSPLRISPSTRVGKVVCFRSQTVYTPKEADTVTFAVRGGDVYITAIDSFVAGQTPHLRPDPPIKAVDGSGAQQWSGRFGGPSSGQYAGSAIGRKSFTFQGRRQRAFGVELRFSFAGELRGTSRQDNYVSLKNGTVFQQVVQQDRDFGGESVRLRYKSTLKSFSGG